MCVGVYAEVVDAKRSVGVAVDVICVSFQCVCVRAYEQRRQHRNIEQKRETRSEQKKNYMTTLYVYKVTRSEKNDDMKREEKENEQ